MKLLDYQRFTKELRQTLNEDPRVIGLVALGSMARQDYQPDEWSDHDFFVITIQGVQEDMRQDLSWLPRWEELIFHFRETEHGLKALYRNGHLVEFAVFNEEELQAARLNRYRVLIDKAALTADLAELALATKESLKQSQTGPERRFAEFLMNLFVGVGRQARGEQLSGHQFICTYALTHLLRLLAENLPSENRHLLDNLDPARRFEKVFPKLGAELNQIVRRDILSAAEGLLMVAERELRPFLSEFPEPAAAAVRQLIVQARQKGADEH